MQGPRGDGAEFQALREAEYVELNETEFMVNFFAEGAKSYWRLWGPLGEPMVAAVDEWAKMQLVYLQWIRQVTGMEG